ncbi:PREDICTED: uncharacterized protein LOC108563839 [Nicrophorus vespilloides]|uniref:Uncharacterized protein LOC108563839 n=1 Tax=Nicrophorus vespilloides TaxID=110193 RepID=A0ABM1MU74_NICVS|nr:PREDICTED: uncharacterized protein LOC108563839 [Nicrophorus vespilloides]
MRKGFSKDEEANQNTLGDGSNSGNTNVNNNFDSLDLLNLPLSYSSDDTGVKDRRRKSRHYSRVDREATGDEFHRHPVVSQEQRANHYNPSGDNLEQGPRPCRDKSRHKLHCDGCERTREGEKSVVCLYNNYKGFSKESLPRTVTDEFLIPHYKKKNHNERIKHEDTNQYDLFTPPTSFHAITFRNKHNRERVASKGGGSFPFRATSSGNLKINSHQVVFETDKFSVLVAEPNNTKVNISERKINNAKMQKDSDYSKNSAINAIMKQQGLGSSLGSLLVGRFADAPIRKEKESSEYEGKATSEILDPELNLNRLGYTATDAIDWHEVLLPEKKNLYLELYARITNFTNADCKVYIDNEEFNCHLLVLQCYSEVFHTYVAVKKVELPSDKCSPASFAFIYEWMITGDPSYRELNRENVLDIFNAAKYLKIKDLIEQCWAFIDNPDVFSEDTAFLLYTDAKEKNLPEVRELMLPRIEKFFLMLVSSQDWLELELEDVQNFLQSNYICVNCEMEVFMSAVRWLKHDWENRDKFKTAVLSCVRFGNLAPWQLVDIKRNPDNPEFRDLAKDPDICKMIDDGLAFVIIKYWYGQENDDYQHWNSILALKEPPTRNWSGTEKTYFTYREFLIYLDQYRRTQMIEKSKPRESKRPKSMEVRVSPRVSNEKMNNKIPTIDEFLTSRKPGVGPKKINNTPFRPHQRIGYQAYQKLTHKRQITKREAVRIIERVYLKYRMRKNVVGLAKRLRKVARRRDPSAVLLKKFFEVPKRPSSLSGHSDHYQRFPNKNEATVMRMGLPKQLDFKGKETRIKKPDYEFNTINDVQLNVKRKEYLTETSLYYLEHESVLVFGGINVHNKYGIGRNTGKDIYRYLPINNDWEYVGEMPAPRTHHCVAFMSGRIYVVGGSDPREDDVKGKFVVVDTVWSFEPVKRIWFTEGSLNVRRKNFGLVVCSKILFAVGGQDKNSRVTDSVEKYNANSGIWDFVAPMRHPRMGIACTTFEERIWVGGGMCGSSQRPLTDSVECYDMEANQWTEITRLRVPRCFATFFAMSNNLYLIAGAGRHKNAVNNTISFSSIDIWNKEDQVWEEHAEMEVARHGHTTAYLGTQILIIGGVTTVYMRSLSSIECFCTTRGTWIRGMSTLPNCLSGHATVTLPPAILM